MIWLHPWALLGLLGVALPIAIHILGRGHADSRRFPSLRFIEASRLMPTRRTRIQDPLLLLIRCGIVALAAAAVAHPIVMTARRWTSLDRGRARAIVVDTSASMNALIGDGRRARAVARDSAKKLAAASQASVIVETAESGQAIDGAAAWLSRQQREGEIVVLSDFQSGSIEQADVNRVPRDLGIALVRIGAVNSAATDVNVLESGRTITGTKSASGSETRIQWSIGRDSVESPFDRVTMLAPARDSALLDATRAAAATVAVPLPLDSTRSVAVIFPGTDYKSASPLRGITRPWMSELLLALQGDSVRIDRFGEEPNGRLVLFTPGLPGSIESARLVARAYAALSAALPVSELETTSLSDDALRAWSRPATSPSASTQHRPTNDEGPSDARWFWVGALALLALEGVVRRARRNTRVADEVRARAA